MDEGRKALIEAKQMRAKREAAKLAYAKQKIEEHREELEAGTRTRKEMASLGKVTTARVKKICDELGITTARLGLNEMRHKGLSCGGWKQQRDEGRGYCKRVEARR